MPARDAGAKSGDSRARQRAATSRLKPKGWEVQPHLLTSALYEDIEQVVHLLAGAAVLLGGKRDGVSALGTRDGAVVVQGAPRGTAPDTSVTPGCYWAGRRRQQLLYEPGREQLGSLLVRWDLPQALQKGFGQEGSERDSLDSILFYWPGSGI